MIRIRAGVIGVGFIGRAHIEAIQRIPQAEVTAVVIRDKGKARDATSRLGIPRWYSDYREMLTRSFIIYTYTHSITSLTKSLRLCSIGKDKQHG
jgi:predicted dehydrogenase